MSEENTVEKLEEAEVDVNKIIKDLGDLNWSKSNETQGKGVSLMRGLAFSDDPKANEFMKAVDKATTIIAKKVLGTTNEDVLLNQATRHLL